MATKKQIKKAQLSNKTKTSTTDQNEIQRLIRIILVVVGVFLAFTLITYFVENNKKTTTEEETTIQYDVILLASLFDQTEDDYYVLVTKDEDPNITVYETYASYALEKDKDFRLYYSYLDEVFNQEFVGEKSNIKKKDLKVANTTLIRIKDKKIKSYYEGKEKITEYLQDLIK